MKNKKRLSVIALLALLFLQIMSPFGWQQEMAASAASDGEGMANLNYTFETTEGGMVSTAADPGQVTVLVFGKTNCGNSQATIKNIAAGGWAGRADIRVIFAECNQASREEVQSFARSYGCDDIMFCYEEAYGGKIYNAMWEYYDLFHDPNASNAGGTLPFTVMIDGNNRARRFLTGNQTAGVIMNEMKEFLAAGDGSGDGGNTEVSVDIPGVQNYDNAAEVFRLVNETRAALGLDSLQLDKVLMERAMQRAAELAVYYSHTRPDGSQCFTISDRGTRKSENIAVGYSSPAAVMEGWINSPGHYANITDSQVTSVGIGCFQDSRGVLNWVQFFDNDAADPASVAGTEPVTRTVSVKKDFLHLQTEAGHTFEQAEKGTTLAMEVWHANEEWEGSRPMLAASSFYYRSSNSAVADVSENGIITLLGEGTAVITASLKDDASVLVEKTITVGQSTPLQSSIPNQTDTPNPMGTPNPGGSPGLTGTPVPGGLPQQTAGPGSGDTKNEMPAKNTVLQDASGNTYQVTKSDAANAEVTFVRAEDSAVSKVNVPEQVTIGKFTYKVTAISAKAFQGNTKLKKAVVGTNVRSIGKKAFYQCRNLKTLEMRTGSLTNGSVGAKAFQGIHKKVRITVPKKKLTAYRKFLRKKGIGKKAVYQTF